jgi:hypothetical protein
MRRLLVITIDTEIDKSSDWKVSKDESFRSVLEGIPDRMEPLFRTYGAKGTYLLSSEVMERDDCTSVLRSLPRTELGTHLHGDLVEPFRAEGNMSGQNYDAMQCSYAPEVERMKMIVLTDLFKERFGHAPSSFRAGRFGAGNNTVKVLRELGYRVDSSVSPGMDWDFPHGRVDFMNALTQPYLVKDDLLRADEGDLLEVPVMIYASRSRKALHSSSSNQVLRKWNHLANKVVPAVWFRPSYHSAKQMIGVAERTLRENADRGSVVLNMMFHSMEVVPGASPYAQSELDCKALLDRIGTVLEWAQGNDVEFVTLADLYPIYKG